MRREPTRGEAVLWRALRTRQLARFKFRRQQPIGPFITEFFCPAARLVVEIDGITHTDPEADARRDRWMQGEGLRVLRIASQEVRENLEGVLETIRQAVLDGDAASIDTVDPGAASPLPPTPSRKGRGG